MAPSTGPSRLWSAALVAATAWLWAGQGVATGQRPASRGFFHTIEGAADDSVIPGRQDWVRGHLRLASGDFLVASTFNGNHSDVACAGRSFANLTLISAGGTTRWSSTFEALPADAVRAIPNGSGFVMTVARRYCHVEHLRPDDLEIWQVDRRGRLGEQLAVLDATLVDSVQDGDGLMLLLERAGALSLRHLGPDGNLGSEHPLSVEGRVTSFTRTPKSFWLLISAESGQTLLEVSGSGFESVTHELPFAATHIAGSPSRDFVYVIASPRYRHPELRIATVGAADGESALDYRGTYGLTVAHASVDPDGALWLLGDNDDNPAFVVFAHGHVVQDRVFVSGLPNGVVRDVTFGPGRITLSGSTYYPGPFGIPDADIFLVSYEPDDPSSVAELDRWSDCVFDIDRYRRAAAKLERRLKIAANLEVHRRGRLERGRPRPWVAYQHGRPAAPPDCSQARATQAIRFLEALDRQDLDADWSAYSPFELDLTFPGDGTEVSLTAPAAKAHRMPLGADAAGNVWRWLERDIRPSLSAYATAHRELRSEAGLILEFDPRRASFAEVASIYADVLSDWRELSVADQRRAAGASAYYRVRFGKGGRIDMTAGNDSADLSVRADDRADVVPAMLRLAQALGPVLALQGDFWWKTGIRISAQGPVDARHYANTLKRLLDDERGLRAAGRMVDRGITDIVVVVDPDRSVALKRRYLVVPMHRLEHLARDLTDTGPVAAANRPALPPEEILGMAIRYGWPNQLDQAIRRGADVLDPCFAGQSPLHQAARSGRTAMAMTLLAHGAPVNARDANGDTPLHLALEERRVGTAEALLRAGADPNLLTHADETVLDVALRRAHSTPRWLIDLLRDYGGRKGPGRKRVSYVIPAYGCTADSGVPTFVLGGEATHFP